ncbi:hypothetical protein Goari_023591 [Gossypium aridum]|uniref:Uncharacterized protein n=2 Tax=Gossypium aridum TaxID=34290 RepID=A0A7J8X3G6_GOSAI|nr:hypothetical protein [Gossypium aridum]
MFGPPSPLIENYLRKAGFWHVANIGWGCKLDSKLISAFIERLPADGSVLTGSAQSVHWGAVCYDLLGAILDNIYGGQIEMGWLRDTFLEPGDDSTELGVYRVVDIVPGDVPDDATKWNHSASYVGILTALEDIRLLLDQRLETHWTPYEDPAIWEVIPDEFLQNPNIWHVRVPLVNYTIIEMHQTDRVLR